MAYPSPFLITAAIWIPGNMVRPEPPRSALMAAAQLMVLLVEAVGKTAGVPVQQAAQHMPKAHPAAAARLPSNLPRLPSAALADMAETAAAVLALVELLQQETITVRLRTQTFLHCLTQ